MPSHAPPASSSPQKLSFCPQLIGRASQLELLELLLAQARRNEGPIVLISGEAGIGKTRLLTEVRARAEGAGFLTLEGNCFEPDRRLPYALLIDLLRNYIATQSPEALAAQRADIAPELAKLLPELAALFSEPVSTTGQALKPSSFLEPEQEKKQVFQAIFRLLTRNTPSALNAGTPRLLIVEDLHWSDETSLEFLLQFARQIKTRSILLVLTYRSDETHPALDHFLAGLDRQRLATEITLTPLTREQIEAMIRAIFELQEPVRREFLDRIYSLTEGNPFFVEEILKSLIAAGEIYYADGRWERKPIQELHIPRSIHDAVQRRTEQLDPAAQQVLALAAVAGRRFDFRLLQELTQMNEWELVTLIKQLVGAQLVTEESADELVFRHALTREAVYSELLLRERRALHRRVADTLERLYPDALDMNVTDLAYHYHAAGDWGKALEYSQRAGEKAARMYAPREAIEQFTRALEAAGKVAHPARTNLYHTRGQAYETIGDFENARLDYEAELRIARTTHDLAVECQAVLALGFLWASRDYTRTGEYFQQALALARTLGDPHTLAHTLNRVGNWYVNIEQPHEAVVFHQEALAIFEELNDRPGLAETFDLLGMASEEIGDPWKLTNYFRRAITLFREFDDRQGLASSLASVAMRGENFFSSVCAALPVTLAEVLSDAETALKLAREIGWRAGESYALAVVGICRAPYGEYERALQALQNALNTATEIEHPEWMSMSHGGLGDIYGDLGALDTAQRQKMR